MLTQKIQAGNYETIRNGQRYNMSSLIGIVKDIKTENSKKKYGTRGYMKVVFKNNKALGFYTYIDPLIKEGGLVKIVGVVTKRGNFFEFDCIGGCERILSQYEFKQIKEGKELEETELGPIPWEMISTVEETKPILPKKFTPQYSLY